MVSSKLPLTITRRLYRNRGVGGMPRPRPCRRARAATFFRDGRDAPEDEASRIRRARAKAGPPCDAAEAETRRKWSARVPEGSGEVAIEGERSSVMGDERTSSARSGSEEFQDFYSPSWRSPTPRRQLHPGASDPGSTSASALGIGRTTATSALAAPSFSACCLNDINAATTVSKIDEESCHIDSAALRGRQPDMGNLIVEQVVSADGFAADRNGTTKFFEAGDGSNDLEDALQEGEAEALEMMENVDAIVLGANTYKLFVEYWPTQDPTKQRIAKPLNELPMHVFSKTLKEAPWGNFRPATVERGDVVETIAELRTRYQRDLVVWGSLKLTETLFRARIVDVLRLRTVPKLIGEGRTVTPKDLEIQPMKLDRIRHYPKGLVNHQYLLEHSMAAATAT